MKGLKFIFGCLFALVLINCPVEDSTSTTEIEVINESSYGLHIEFEDIFSRNWFEEINVKKGESFTFFISDIGGKDGVKPRNPNNEVGKIIFINSETNEIIKEIINNNLFELIKSLDDYEHYKLYVNDILLL